MITDTRSKSKHMGQIGQSIWGISRGSEIFVVIVDGGGCINLFLRNHHIDANTDANTDIEIGITYIKLSDFRNGDAKVCGLGNGLADVNMGIH